MGWRSRCRRRVTWRGYGVGWTPPAGIHKAPTNETVLGVTDLEYLLTDEEQEPLNSEGVNCLRVFPGQGIRVWGARTLDTVDSDWTYINVRRLINHLEESIRLGTHWAVLEPNDGRLWSAIQRNVSSFLMDMYRAGSLFGATAEEAFYVVCNASPPGSLSSKSCRSPETPHRHDRSSGWSYAAWSRAAPVRADAAPQRQPRPT
ncbi:phage tail sheath subtilisin-like domain-containing protein [Streptomyces sp. NPDC092307]|uniref:phage tail sheath subtilisin-like domain-containing protein n=1 Tax=Streptomyces sp. NPDC092307 TaxID=3366013 RepID=UPI00381879D8